MEEEEDEDDEEAKHLLPMSSFVFCCERAVELSFKQGCRCRRSNVDRRMLMMFSGVDQCPLPVKCVVRDEFVFPKLPN
mgnify:CR=1 FL=1